MMQFARSSRSWCKDWTGQTQASVGKLSEGLHTKLILPAGNGFEFKGLNVNDRVHAYTTISYKTQTRAKLQKTERIAVV